MATKFSLVPLNLLLISLLFSQCLAGGYSGFSGKAKNKNGNTLNMLKAAEPYIKSFLDGFNKQPNTTAPSPNPSNQTDANAAQSSGLYEVSFAIGTPTQNFTTVMDISTNMIWTQCDGQCLSCINQSTPLYKPNISSTYSQFSSLRCSDPNFNQSSVCKSIKPNECPKLKCPYSFIYDAGKLSAGYLATETFTFGPTSVPDIVFGCGTVTYGEFGNASGVLGLARGPFSFVSQLQLSRFSYCLSSDQTKDSPVNFGSSAKLESGSGQSTPLLMKDTQPWLYYIGLIDITVGTTLLNIPNSTFELKPKGLFGGVFLTTAIPVTTLEIAGYDLVKKAIISQMNQTTVDGSALNLDLCFNNSVTKSQWPSLTLHFAGNASLKLKSANYMVKDPDTGIECLTIIPSLGFSKLGSFIQMDTNFVYDLANSTISFEKCNVDGGTNNSSSVMSHIPHLVTTMVLFLFCMLKFF